MTIKHLVLSGGGGGGYMTYGAVKYLCKNNYLSIENIENIFCASIGSLISVLISLNIDWNVLDDYLIKRPWDKVITIKPTNLLNLWTEKGILNGDVFKKVLNPLLTVKDLSESITMLEFYNYNKIEIHMYTTNINESIPVKVDLSYKTHPNLELCKAITMSSAFPILLMPVYDNSACYIDGGVINNFPLNDCIDKIGGIESNKLDEILAFKIYSSKKFVYIDKDSSLLNYLYTIIDGIRNLASTENNQIEIENIVKCEIENNDFNLWKDALLYENIRRDIIETGEKCSENFLNEGRPSSIP